MNVNYLTYRNRKEVKKLGPLQIMGKHSNRDNVSTESFYFREQSFTFPFDENKFLC